MKVTRQGETLLINGITTAERAMLTTFGDLVWTDGRELEIDNALDARYVYEVANMFDNGDVVLEWARDNGVL